MFNFENGSRLPIQKKFQTLQTPRARIPSPNIVCASIHHVNNLLVASCEGKCHFPKELPVNCFFSDSIPAQTSGSCCRREETPPLLLSFQKRCASDGAKERLPWRISAHRRGGTNESKNRRPLHIERGIRRETCLDDYSSAGR